MLGKVCFVLYIGFIIYFLIFSDWYGRTTTGMEDYRYNLVLFKEIKRFWEYRDHVGFFRVFLAYGQQIQKLLVYNVLELRIKPVRGDFPACHEGGVL